MSKAKSQDGRLERVGDVFRTPLGLAAIYQVGHFGQRIVLTPDPEKTPGVSKCLHGKPLRPLVTAGLGAGPLTAEALCSLCPYEIGRVSKA